MILSFGLNWMIHMTLEEFHKGFEFGKTIPFLGHRIFERNSPF